MPDADPSSLLSPIRERALMLTLGDIDRAVPAVREALKGDHSNPDYFAALVAEAALKTFHPIYRADVVRLLKAVDAALKAADGWDAEGLVLAAGVHGDCARELRAAITTALAGEEAGDG